MSAAAKNTIILFILLVVITSAGVFRVHIYSTEKLKRIEKMNAEKRIEIKSIADKVKNYDVAVKVLEDSKMKWRTREKVLQKDEQSGGTLLFLNDIASKSNSAVKFDFTFLEVSMDNGYGFGKYSITGEGTYYSVYGFINEIENARNLYKIKMLNIQGVDEVSEKTDKPVTIIKFSFILESYFSSEGDEETEYAISNEYVNSVINPFNPLVKKSLPPNNNGLIEVENAKLEAISYDMIIVKDNKGGFTSLKVGDKVYLGYLTSINPKQGEAEFTLNKGGIIEKVILKIFVKN